jgi:ATP-dependent Zn protease
MARDMVARFGMSDEISLMRLYASDSSAYLGEETPLQDIGPETKADADRGIRRLLQEAETEAEVLLDHHRKLLDEFAATLAVEETLEGAMLQEHVDALQAKMQPAARGRVRAKGVSESAKSEGAQTRSRRRTSPSAS